MLMKMPSSLIDAMLQLFISENPLIVLGDFNIDWSCCERPNSQHLVKFKEFFECCNLTQHVTKPTRGGSILDIVLTSAPILKNISILPPFASSDLNVVGFEVLMSPVSQRELPLPNFNKANNTGLQAILQLYRLVEDFPVLPKY